MSIRTPALLTLLTALVVPPLGGSSSPTTYPPPSEFLPDSALTCAPDETEHHVDAAVPGHDGVRVAVFTLCEGDLAAANAGPGSGPPAASALTDCPSTEYARLPYRQTAPWFGLVQNPLQGDDSHSDEPTTTSAFVLTDLQTGAQAWDVHTLYPLYAWMVTAYFVHSGLNTNYHNHIRWVPMGATNPILARALVYYAGGIALDSDIEFNDDQPWTTSWSAAYQGDYFIVENVAAHEFGHLFGLGHPATTPANECLTMYPYMVKGDLSKTTLGDGDILGIRAIYG